MTIVKKGSQRQGQFLINKIRFADDFPIDASRSVQRQTIEMRIWNMSDEKFDKIMDEFDEHDIAVCPKCGCKTVVYKDDKWTCEDCNEVII